MCIQTLVLDCFFLGEPPPGGSNNTTEGEIMTKFYATLMSFVAAPKRDEKGATAVEYGLIVALIAAVIVGTVLLVGQDVLTGFQTVETNI